MKLGEKIYSLRKESGLSQEQLAEEIHVARQTISNWELGSTCPNPEQLKLLSQTFKVSIDELLDNDVASVLVEKVSNTEKLAGMIIKILKGIGIFILVFLIIDILSFVLYVSIGNRMRTEHRVSMVCSFEEKNYQIELGTDQSFVCEHCSSTMKEEIETLVDFNQIDKSMDRIEEYFLSHAGSCE